MASVVPLSNLGEILVNLSNFLYLITGNEGEKVFNTRIRGYSIYYHPHPQIITRVFSYIALQIKIMFGITKVDKKIDLYVIFMGEGLLIPMLFCKLLRKPVLLILASSATKISGKNRDSLSLPFVFMETANYRLADRIVVYSSKLIDQWGLEKYRYKISIAPNHFLDLEKFKIRAQLNQRSNVIGYVGRLSEEKGITNFVKSMPEILKSKNGINFLIAGDGKLRDDIITNLNKYNLKENVELNGWIPHDDLPQFLNRLKLLVIPSYTEGLPNVMIEAMACGTPVLATPVGAISDFIKDAETGFIMEDNSPECIARNVVRAMNHPYLDQIANNGKMVVEKEFTFEKALERFKIILNRMDLTDTKVR